MSVELDRNTGRDTILDTTRSGLARLMQTWHGRMVLFAFVVAMLGIIAFFNRQIPSNQNSTRIIGRMGNAKLAIPPEFILGPIAYKGVDIWKSDTFKSSPKHPTFDNQIDIFAIRIRQHNLKPIESELDRREYRKSYEAVMELPPRDNRWIHVGLDARRYPMSSASEKARSWYKDDAHWGPFVKAPDVWGMSHYVSVQLPTSDTLHGDQVEYFYNEESDSVFMFCWNTLRKVPPHDPLSNCQIEFSVPELMAYADITNIRDKADLASWRQMRDGVMRVVNSFIVP
jgi:hypothetical protein